MNDTKKTIQLLLNINSVSDDSYGDIIVIFQ